MTELELDKMCEKNPECGCNCMNCVLFAEYIESQQREGEIEDEYE